MNMMVVTIITMANKVMTDAPRITSFGGHLQNVLVLGDCFFAVASSGGVGELVRGGSPFNAIV